MHPLSPSRGARRATVVSLTAVLLAGLGAGPGAAATGRSAPVTGTVATATGGSTATAAGRPRSSIAKMPGTLFYVKTNGRDPVVRLTRSGPVTVLPKDGYSANISPNGRRIAYVKNSESGGRRLVVADRNGRHGKTLLRDVIGVGSAPVWSPDSTRLLVTRKLPRRTVGIVNVRTGAFTKLPYAPKGIHFLWSADGRHLAYGTGICRLVVTDRNGGNARVVPIIGDPNPRRNPRQLRSCDPFSISRDGTRMAVDLRVGNEPDGDIVRNLKANAVVDTRTGALVRLPVAGRVLSVVFRPDGSTLVRTRIGGRNRLTLLSRSNTVLARVVEPKAVRKFSLLAHTRY